MPSPRWSVGTRKRRCEGIEPRPPGTPLAHGYGNVGAWPPSPPTSRRARRPASTHPLWTTWTKWTLWTAIFRFRIHAVHAVHIVHSSAPFGAGERVWPPVPAAYAAGYCLAPLRGCEQDGSRPARSAQTPPPPTQGRWGARGGYSWRRGAAVARRAPSSTPVPMVRGSPGEGGRGGPPLHQSRWGDLLLRRSMLDAGRAGCRAPLPRRGKSGEAMWAWEGEAPAEPHPATPSARQELRPP